MRVSNKVFKCIVESAPLISVDFLIKVNTKYLLGKRINEPAKGYFFTIGGRIFKNETIKEAQKRILKEELNLDINKEFQFLGIFEHFYKTSVFSNNISTHYVNLAYLVELDSNITNDLPKVQHNEYKYFTKDEILNSNEVHNYVKDYFKGSKYV